MSEQFDLIISRVIKASRSEIFKAWQDPAVLASWWCPKPWSTKVVAFDFVAGGAFHTLMSSPQGEQSDNPGCFLEIVPDERIVFTSCLLAGWQPAEPWLAMTAIITLEDDPKGTRYTATVRHKNQQECQQHEEMGFYEGWGMCIEQLAALVEA